MYSEPMPASKRKAFSEPMPQPYSDMMGIELVLHASLLHSMREGDSTDETKEAACSVTSQLEAQERAEKLAANNFNQTNDETTTAIPSTYNVKNSFSTDGIIDPEFVGALEKARSYVVAAAREQESLSTENDDSEILHELKRVKQEGGIREINGSTSSDDRTDQEDQFTSSASDFHGGIVDLKKLPLPPATEC